MTAATTRGEQTRQAILDAAEALFTTHGYHGTSMRQIAREAGQIAVGGIYNHFEGKEDIFLALLIARSPSYDFVAAFHSLDSSSGPELLAEVFKRMQVIILRNLNYISLIMIDFQEFQGKHVREIAGDVVPVINAFGEQVQALGGMRPDLDGHVAIRAFASMMFGYALTQVIAYQDDRPMLPGIPDIDDATWQQMVIEAMLYGIADGR